MAIKTKGWEKPAEGATWEEESGLLDFLSTVNAEVERFDATFDFGVRALLKQPLSIDGSADLLNRLGFVVVRHNSALTGRDYCLYSVLQGRSLYGYIGVYSDERIETVRELRPTKDFRTAPMHLLGWLRDLVKASCEKP